MNVKEVPKKYRPIPFWSWNEKLEAEETKAQVKAMDEVGIGGYFMHARGGLKTPYMEDEWFENVTAAVEEGRERGMYPWAYDENGWPSGFGSGMVNGLGVEYQQKYLRMEAVKEHEETAICKCGEHYFYYEVNPFYVDTLDRKVIAKFIEVAYKPYYEKYGTAVEGFFTDEPQISRNGIPWSFVFEEEYRSRYGEKICEHLEELFLEIGDYKQTRVKFWKMVTELFSEAFMKQIYEQCREWGMKLTGHLVLEENMLAQLVSNGACMPHYEYMDIPGMDWLGRNIVDCLTARQVSSVAEQTGKEQVLSETFALCGHNVSFAELKGIYEWQMVRGINLLCQHLEGYSLRGIRKRDYPPAMYLQQPWWSAYDKLVDALSRESMLLSKGEKKAEILLLHPQTTAWTLYNDRDESGINALDARFIEDVKALERKHVLFHLGDEIMLERHGEVKEGRLIVGEQSYTTVINSCCETLLPNTKELLAAFEAAGGQIMNIEDIPADPVVDLGEITYTKRFYPDCTLHYFVNTSAEERKASFTVTGKAIDIYSGELLAFDGYHTFEPWGSLMVLEDVQDAAVTSESTEGADQCDQTTAKRKAEIKEETVIVPDGEFTLEKQPENCLTLDRCDYWFDGELQEENGYVLNICERANALERQVHIHQEYRVSVEKVPSSLYLVCETPWNFEIRINGAPVNEAPVGYFRDKSFCKIPVTGLLTEGKNTISFDCDFMQSEEFYANRRKSFIFESEKNKLAYDMEIEAIYLVGDFGVKTSGEWTALERNASRYHGDFVITALPEKISLQQIEKQGFPFFAGELTVEGELNITGENPVLVLRRKGINAVKVEIAGKEALLLTTDKLSLTSFGAEGKTPVRFTLINNLRNLLGPHHLKVGESYGVGPNSFFKESCVWNTQAELQWDDDYCFVELSL